VVVARRILAAIRDAVVPPTAAAVPLAPTPAAAPVPPTAAAVPTALAPNQPLPARARPPSS